MGPKVLLVRLSSLGDVILATSAVEAVKAANPQAEIHFLTKPAFAGVFAHNPHVSKLHLWQEGEGALSVAKRLSGFNFSNLIDLHANLRTRLLRFFLPGPWSVYRKGSLRRRLAVALKAPSLLNSAPHVLDRYASALGGLGVKNPGIPRLYPTDDEREAALSLLRDAGWDGVKPLIAYAPGARWKTKAWPPEHWKRLAELSGQRFGAYPVFIGGEGERQLCDSLIPASGGANLAGKLGVTETAVLLSRCLLLVSNDSAPLHMAAGVDAPVVALFGPTVKGFGFYPRGVRAKVVEVQLSCRPCSLHGGDECPRGHFDCMRKLAPEAVLEAMAEAASSKA